MGQRRFGITEDGQRVTGEYPGPDVVGPALQVLGNLRPRLVRIPGFGQREGGLTGKQTCLAGSTTASASLSMTASVPWPAWPRSRMRVTGQPREPARLILVLRERAAEIIRAARESGRGLGQQPGAPHRVLPGRREPRGQPAGQVRQRQPRGGVRKHPPPGRIAALRPGHPPPDHPVRLFPVRRAHPFPGIAQVGGELEAPAGTGRAAGPGIIRHGELDQRPVQLDRAERLLDEIGDRAEADRIPSPGLGHDDGLAQHGLAGTGPDSRSGTSPRASSPAYRPDVTASS